MLIPRLKNYVLAFAICITSEAFATEVYQDGVLQNLSQEKTEPYLSTRLFELTTALSTQSGYISQKLNAAYGSQPYLSIAVNTGYRQTNQRFFVGLGIESMGQLISPIDGSNLTNLRHVFLKGIYERPLTGFNPNYFVFGSFSYIPQQGSTYTSDQVKYSPKSGSGYELGLGWVSPFYLAFHVGYRQQQRNYQFTSFGSAQSADVGYRGFFLTTSFGRF